MGGETNTAAVLQLTDAPTNSAWFAHLDCQLLRASVTGRVLLAQFENPEAEQAIASFVASAGFDPRTGITNRDLGGTDRKFGHGRGSWDVGQIWIRYYAPDKTVGAGRRSLAEGLLRTAGEAEGPLFIAVALLEATVLGHWEIIPELPDQPRQIDPLELISLQRPGKAAIVFTALRQLEGTRCGTVRGTGGSM